LVQDQVAAHVEEGTTLNMSGPVFDTATYMCVRLRKAGPSLTAVRPSSERAASIVPPSSAYIPSACAPHLRPGWAICECLTMTALSLRLPHYHLGILFYFILARRSVYDHVLYDFMLSIFLLHYTGAYLGIYGHRPQAHWADWFGDSPSLKTNIFIWT
jgi:hypothetical protein